MSHKYPPKSEEPEERPVHLAAEECLEAFADACAAAQLGDNAGVLHFLQSEADVNGVNGQDEQGTTLLFWAAATGQCSTAQFLLEKGAETELADLRGWTPLHAAAYYGKWEMCRTLVNAGANADARQKDGWSVLHYAARRGNAQAVNFLAEHGADVNASDEDSETVLHTAAYSANLEAVRALVEKGADVNAADEDGWTVLHAACRSGNLLLVKMLTEEFHADLNARDADELTPLEYVRELIAEQEEEKDEFTETSSVAADYTLLRQYLEEK